MKVTFLKDCSVKYGYWINQRKQVKAGEVFDLNSNLAQRYIKAGFAVEGEGGKKVAKKATENKVAKPQSNTKYTLGEKRAFGWFDIMDEEGNVVDKAKGEQAAQEKLKELNG